ncbi:MAG: Extracellular solute-binding protein [Deltaproteobacteria bacterium]|nr:Extracellular solute-binding protein [Deltaproteobacteria bacterium]
MKFYAKLVAWSALLVSIHSTAGAETQEQLIAGAKKESEITFIAGAQTFGGPKTLSVLEAAFNKRFGLNMKIRFAAGPEMNAMAARLITEVKNGSKASSDLYHGSQSHLSLLHKEKALEKVNYSGIFPWITKEMEIFPGEGVLIFTSLRGMIYNSKLISKEKAPKTYEDLVDPKLSPTWAGKLAIPPYVSWLVELSMIWSEDKVKSFTKKLVALSGGRLRYSEEERVVSGEFPIAANMGGATEQMWQWQAKGAPLVAVMGSTPVLPSYFQLAVPKNSAHPNLSKLFVGFMASKEAQAILEKQDFRTSHLVDGTIMSNYLKQNKIKLQTAKESIDFYLQGEDSGLELKEELTKMLKR